MFLALCALSAALLLPSSDSAAIRYNNMLESHYFHLCNRGAELSDGYLYLLLDIGDIGDQAPV